ncbi:amidase [Oricola cellulosilytica]|uniref:Amidase n=1 Tax=Oricola cellulosilytica TaxID=1429082 RepID=A0A4R0P661_9HYPH|nr:amidase [Oricola cellulosilytica]TCD11363.1 amidase [Oricola cellulosilytica]
MDDAIRDAVHAFMPHGFDSPVAHAEAGALAGLTFAVKDMYDVAGLRTGFGNPVILERAEPATETNSVIQRLLDAGARMVGKTQCDELTFSLMGENAHYRRPINSAAPDRVTGGSSSGSAAAVAAGLCDFAIGSDTGGSVRGPASFCGLFGLRPTHGAIGLDHARGLAPSFDTFGWFARDVDIFQRVADVVLPPDTVALAAPELVVPAFAEALLAAESVAHWNQIKTKLGLSAKPVSCLDAVDENYMLFRRLQAYEAWALHGDFVSDPASRVSADIAERFRFGEPISCGEAAADTITRTALRDELAAFLGSRRMLVMPTMPGPAPLAAGDPKTRQAYREQALRLLCVSGLTGFPQMSIPAGVVDGAPFGVSVLGPKGSDRAVIAIAEGLAGRLRQNAEIRSA